MGFYKAVQVMQTAIIFTRISAEVTTLPAHCDFCVVRNRDSMRFLSFLGVSITWPF
jgi:hypothetical protein